MADSRQLSRLVENAEDLAYALTLLRDEVPRDPPRDVTNITGAIGELYRLSNILRQLENAAEDSGYGDRMYRISNEVRLVCRSIQRTTGVALGMIGRADDATQWMVWEDLDHRMRVVERVSLLSRLSWYHVFVQGLLGQLRGYAFDDTLVRIKGNLKGLLERQDDVRADGWLYQAVEPGKSLAFQSVKAESWAKLRLQAAASTPRARIAGPPSPRLARRPGSDFSEPSRANDAPPPAPEAPLHSPVVTWSSTRTYVSSSEDSPSRRTSYSSYDVVVPTHWAEYIFHGHKWRSRYRGTQQLNATTRCKGAIQADAKIILGEEGFFSVADVEFSDNGSIATFYWRPHDNRARILFTAINGYGQETLYCTPLNCLRIFRKDSILQLCHASSHEDDLFWNWAELKFVYHERMVLFWSTFIALKRQDSQHIPPPLIEDPRDMEEKLLFCGVIHDNGKSFALRLLQDRGSGVVRLEARPFRGARDGVPIWTAFLTKYVGDRDIFAPERHGIVSMICPKPKPYIFLSDYGLPLMPNGNDFALHFEVREDARNLIEVWNELCGSGRR